MLYSFSKIFETKRNKRTESYSKKPDIVNSSTELIKEDILLYLFLLS